MVKFIISLKQGDYFGEGFPCFEVMHMFYLLGAAVKPGMGIMERQVGDTACHVSQCKKKQQPSN
jgi:hypothetical protein